MQKQNWILIVAATALSMVVGAMCNEPQPSQAYEKPFEYFKKPMRKLEPQLMDEVLEYAPDEIKDVIEMVNNAGIKESIRVMLVGSPGVGKTTLAQAIALQTGRPCYIVRAPSLSNQFQFSGEQNLIAAISPLFEKEEPCVVIVDEIDALKQYKGDKANQDASPANTLCNLLDDAEEHPHIVFIATTNKLKQIPEDLRSRFGTVVTLPLPDQDARERIIRYHLKELKKAGIDVNLDENTIKVVASKTAGFSAREIKAMILKSKIKARRAGDLLQEQQVWEAYKAEKPLIGSASHIKDTLVQFAKDNGAAFVTCAVSAALTILGIVLCECRSNEGNEHRDKQDRKEKQRKLLGQIIAHRKMRQDEKVKKDANAILCCVCNEKICEAKLARTLAAKGSEEAIYFKCKCEYFKQKLMIYDKNYQQGKNENSLVNRLLSFDDKLANCGCACGVLTCNPLLVGAAAICKIDVYLLRKLDSKKQQRLSVRAVKVMQKDQETYMKEYLSLKFAMTAQELDDFIKKVEAAYRPKLDRKIVLAEQNQNAYEANDANEKSKASAREREESRLDRVGVGVATSYISKSL